MKRLKRQPFMIILMKITLCLAMIATSFWYHSYTKSQLYSLGGYGYSSSMLFAGHIPMLALSIDLAIYTIDDVKHCYNRTCGPPSDWILEAIANSCFVLLNFILWMTGSLVELRTQKGPIWTS